MTDRVNYLTVTLESGIREDDARPLIEAIKLMRGVVDVTINADDPVSFSALAHIYSSANLRAVTPADPLVHARTSPGPENCNRRLVQNQAYPRTCERCGLGPCPFFDNDGNRSV